MTRQSFLVLVFSLAVCLTANGQSKETSPPQTKATAEKTERELEADRLLKERRDNA